MSEQALQVVEQAGGLMPVMSVQNAVARYQELQRFVKSVLVEGVDYGTVAGIDKPALFKAGAEKLTTFFGLAVELEVIHKVEDWTGAEHGGESLFQYTARAYLSRGGQIIATADGSCNSWESKYRWRWVAEHELPPGVDASTLRRRGGRLEEFTFSVDKSETSGKYGKPESYWQTFRDAIEAGAAVKGTRATRANKIYDTWIIESYQYRIPNEDVYSLVNTVLKMAEKRALVAVTLLGTAASALYTQDVEDLADSVTTAAQSPTQLGELRQSVKTVWVTAAQRRDIIPAGALTTQSGAKLKSVLGEIYDSLNTAQAGFIEIAATGLQIIAEHAPQPEQEGDEPDEPHPDDLPPCAGTAPHYSDN